MKKSIVGFSVISSFLLFGSNAFAISLVTSRDALGANDFIDWSQVVGYPQSTTVTSNLGAIATVSALAANGLGPPSLHSSVQGVNGVLDFAPGDSVLVATGDPVAVYCSLFIDFLNPVARAGTQIEGPSGPYTAYLDVYGTDDITLLASYFMDGWATYSGDNSAMFMGVSDTLADIGAIKYSLQSVADCNGPIINQLSLDSTPVPEPSTIFLLSAGLAGLGFVRRRVKN